MLTKKQHELLTFIAGHLEQKGISPSFEEMKDALDLRSKSGVHRLITALEERGFIRRLKHRARALEILKLPDRQPPRSGVGSGREFVPNVIETDFTAKQIPATNKPYPETDDFAAVPLYGRIAAGTPIEALQNNLASIPVPASMMGRGEHYALEIAGDSMIGAGILDGDTAIIERCNTADNGTIVVALVDNEEATLKRVRRKGNSIALEAANEAYETRIFGPDRVKIQGRLKGIIRSY
ncbi:MAG: transcriptional repressor LexA [Sphingomonadales bacterium]